MVRSNAATVEQYLAELDPERRQEVSAVRDVVLANLPEGYQESMNWGMISYEIPLERYPDTYNRQPLVYAALASQKNYMSLYLMGLYGDPEEEQSFEERYRATGKRYDVGKSCVRFRRLEDLPLDLIGEVIASTSVDEHIAHYEVAR
jgi:uncharacterized protein YdhG (YjbR/CyaY superfamily)